ncbi:hypothetical protein CR513_11706, partial [Mucuna pruriens]
MYPTLRFSERMALWSRNVSPTANMNGRVIPATAMFKARFPRLRMNKRPRLATDSSMLMLHDGNTVCMNFLLRPIAEGPSKIPP